MNSARVILVKSIILFLDGTLHAQVTGLSGWNIFLDPGHSRKENMGIYGYSEAEKNVRVALNIRDILLSTTDIDTVFLSRENDLVLVDLTQRTDYANSLGAAWYHSIHSNAGDASSNSTLMLWGQYRTGSEKIPHGGKAMSSIMLDLLTRGMRTNTSGSWGDCTFYGCNFDGPYLHVNRESTMPSELSEAGFHTNPSQNMRNMNKEWKRLEAWTFYCSLLKYFQIAHPPCNGVAGIIKNLESLIPINGAQVNLAGQTYITDDYRTLFYKYSSDASLLHNGFYYFENVPDVAQMIVSAPDYYSDTLQVALVDTFFTFVDVRLVSKKPPFVQNSMPAQNGKNFAAWGDINLYFSRPMNRTSVENAFWFEPAVHGGVFKWYSNNTRMVFKPDTLTYESNYSIHLAGTAMDNYGHSLDGNGDGMSGDEFILAFRTGPRDMSPPKIASVFPIYSSVTEDLQPIITITYDEELDSTSVTDNIFSLEKSGNSEVIPGNLQHYVVRAHSLLTFFPAILLEPDKIYNVKIRPGLRDKHENEESILKTTRFRTGAQNWNITSIDDFESGVQYWWEPSQSGQTTGYLADSTSRQASESNTNRLKASNLSLQINYAWDLSKSEWMIREYLGSGPVKNVHFDRTKIIQIYVFGDGSSTQFRFCVDDRVPNYAASNHEVSPWYIVDWYGWRLVSWRMSSDSIGTWLGDGQLDGMLGFDSIQLRYTPGGYSTGVLYFDDLRLAEAGDVAVDDQNLTTIMQFSLQQNYPNPFNASTNILYSVGPGAQFVKLAIYNLLGEKLRELVNEMQTAGERSVVWNGKDDQGVSVSSGLYLYRLTLGSMSLTKTMVLMN